MDDAEKITQIAILRGGGLGDVLFAMPAMDALAAAYPDAKITLLGTAMHQRLLAHRPGAPHEVQVLPEHALDGGACSRGECEDFFARMRQRHFDLAVQLHGGGRFSNRAVAMLGARHTIGLRAPGALELERTVPYRYYQHEMLRALEVVSLVGADPVRLEPSVTVTDVDRESAAPVLAGLHRSAGLAVVHPGASDLRRRWPAARFASVAAGLGDDGMDVLVIGTQNERDLCEEVAAGAHSTAVRSVAGSLDESALVGVLAAAAVIVADDSGPRHLAQAVGTPTVGVFWVGNAINAAPLGRAHHRVRLSWTVTCPVCGVDCTGRDPRIGRCEHDVSFVADVQADAVLADARELVASNPRKATGSRGHHASAAPVQHCAPVQH